MVPVCNRCGPVCSECREVAVRAVSAVKQKNVKGYPLEQSRCFYKMAKTLEQLKGVAFNIFTEKSGSEKAENLFGRTRNF